MVMMKNFIGSGRLLPVNVIAVDLGTANTLVYVKGEGIVLNEPSVVAVERGSQRIKGIGLEAKRMLGRTPEGIMAVRPLKDGVIADVDITEIMLRHFLRQVTNKRIFRMKPRVIVGVPSGIPRESRNWNGGRFVPARRPRVPKKFTWSPNPWLRRLASACRSTHRPVTWSLISAAGPRKSR
jgi:hypothetical protein